LKKGDTPFNFICETSSDAIVMMDEDGKILYWNPAAERIFGYSYKEILGKDVHKTLAPNKYQQIAQEGLEEFKRTGKGAGVGNTLELTALRKDGSEFPISLSLSTIKIGSTWNAVAIIRDITKTKELEEELRSIEWLLARRISADFDEECVSRYERAVETGTESLIVDSVGEDLLREIVGECLILLDTSTAIFEENGDYAFSLLSSGWCQYLNHASRKLCGTEDDREAMKCGKWLCHESSWGMASKVAIERGEAVDIECHGGVRIFAVPIWLDDKVIGSMNVVYGDPPKDPEKLRRIAKKYQVSVDELTKLAYEYKTRPYFIIETAKKRLQTSANLIGIIVKQKQTEKRMKNVISTLQVIRNVNQLITREKDKDKLIKSICETFNDIRRYDSAWIVLVDESRKPVSIAGAGLGNEFQVLKKQLKTENPPYCFRQALKKSEVLIMAHKSPKCQNCPLSKRYPNSMGIAARLKYGNELYGMMMVSLPTATAIEEEEVALIKEVAEDIAFAFHVIELEEERKARVKKLKEYSNGLEVMVEKRTSQLDKALGEKGEVKSRIDTIISSVADGVIVLDISDRVVLINKAAEDMLGISFNDVVTKHVTEAIGNKELSLKMQLRKIIKKPFFEFDIEVPAFNQMRILHVKTSVVRGENGEPMGTVTLLSDVTERRQVEKKKTEFMATAAHELRTPLTSIQGFSEILLTRELKKIERTRFLKYINQQAVALGNLINDLLDITRIESEKGLKLNKEECDIRELINEVIPYFKELSEKHRFEVVQPAEPVMVNVDKEKINQVLKNIISNSVKYSPQGGEILITLTVFEDHCLICVDDQGIGMTSEQLSRIFEKFYRANFSDTSPEGTGLGMTIVKHIVELHNGNIWVESEYGVGTKVSFTLPLVLKIE